MYKIVDIFGNESTIMPTQNGIKKKNIFTDYESFVDKFEPKKTTDDCYTPTDVYELILNYIGETYDLTNKKIIRPFYPGGDYEQIEYPENCIVIDNPPFSIITKIAKFYISKNIDFFLFAPHLTLFSGGLNCNHIVVGANIEYDNGAIVKTSFLSNIYQDYLVIGDPVLYQKLEELRKSKKTSLSKYEYPDNVLMVSDIAYMIEKGIGFTLKKEFAHHCRQLDSQKTHKKTLFGSGFLISEKAAAEKAAAEKVNKIVWELSDREKQIIQNLK